MKKWVNVRKLMNGGVCNTLMFYLLFYTKKVWKEDYGIIGWNGSKFRLKQNYILRQRSHNGNNITLKFLLIKVITIA